jgi:RES domain-containing protein
MEVWRISGKKYPGLNHSPWPVDGRRHRKGDSVIYTADSLSLAVLELIAHIPKFPPDRLAMRVKIPDQVSVQCLGINDLPPDWTSEVNRQKLQAISARWLESREAAVLRVPSVIVTEGYNYLINAQHRDFNQIAVTAITPVQLDPRAFGEEKGREAATSSIAALILQALPKPDTTRRLRIFLSYSSPDRATVRKIHAWLRQRPWVHAWPDEEELVPGQDWRMEIEKAVEIADVVLVVLSKEAVSRPGFFQKEMLYAVDMADRQPEGTIYLIPLRVNECNMPMRLSRWQWLNWFEESAEAKLQRALHLRAESLDISAESLT